MPHCPVFAAQTQLSGIEILSALLKMDWGVVIARSLTLSINNCVITMQQQFD